MTPQIPGVFFFLFFLLAYVQVYRDREISVTIEYLCRTRASVVHASQSRVPSSVVGDRASLSCAAERLSRTRILPYWRRNALPHYHDIERYIATWKPYVLRFSVQVCCDRIPLSSEHLCRARLAWSTRSPSLVCRTRIASSVVTQCSAQPSHTQPYRVQQSFLLWSALSRPKNPLSRQNFSLPWPTLSRHKIALSRHNF